MVDDIGTVFRDFNNINDPASGEYEPEKPRIRGLLRSIRNSSGLAITRNTLAALTAVTPTTEDYMGIVLDDPDPSNNGYYSRVAAAWVWERGFPDTFARVTLGGTANAQTGSVAAGVDPASTEVFFATVGTDNPGPMTLSIDGETARDVVNLAGNPLSAGEWTGMVMFYLNDANQYQLLIDAGAAAAAADSATAAEASRIAAEAARDAAIAAGANEFAATRTALKALDTSSFGNVYLTEAGREGQFKFVSGDYSAEVALDTAEAIYIKADDTAATAGAWLRIHDGEYLAKWFGAKEDGTTSDRAAVQAAIDLCLSHLRPVPLVLSGLCLIDSPLIIDRAVGSAAGANTFLIRGRGEAAGFTSGLTGSIIDSSLDYVGVNHDTPSCNIAFERISFIGSSVNTYAVSDKFLKVSFSYCRFNLIKAVVASYYLQSWYFDHCSAIGWSGNFIAAANELYDLRLEGCDFESGGNGVKSFNSGLYGGRLTNNLFQGSGQFLSQGKGFGLTIIGNYTEGNSAPDYQLSDPINVGSHSGTVFLGNVMLAPIHTDFNIIVGGTDGFFSAGNYCGGKMFDVTNTTAGSFKSIGDVSSVSKLSDAGFFDLDGSGNYLEASLASGSATSLTTGTAKTVASITLPAGDWDVSGVLCYTPGALAAVSLYSTSISLTDNTEGGAMNKSLVVSDPFVSGGYVVSQPTPVVRVSVFVPTVVYLVAMSQFTDDAVTVYGKIQARRAGGAA